MLAAVMDEQGASFALKEAYRCDATKLSLLVEAFPFAAVLKKVCLCSCLHLRTPQTYVYIAVTSVLHLGTHSS